jgi:hypothetical protein
MAEQDILLKKKIEDHFTEHRIKEVISLLINEVRLPNSAQEQIDLFFIEIKEATGEEDLEYLVLEFCKLYNINIEFLIKNTNTIKAKIKEKRTVKSILSMFI